MNLNRARTKKSKAGTLQTLSLGDVYYTLTDPVFRVKIKARSAIILEGAQKGRIILQRKDLEVRAVCLRKECL